MTLYASVSPPGAAVTWGLVQVPEQSGVSLEPDGLDTILRSSPDDEDATLSVSVALADDPQQHDRRDIHLFKVPGGILGDARDVLGTLTHATAGITPKEAVVLWQAGAACRRAMEEVNAQYGPDVVEHFPVTPDGPFPTSFNRKNGPGNAMHHAYVNCVRVKKCGAQFAKQLGDSHEQFGTNKCSEAAMDLHNNAVGYRLGKRVLSASDCGAAVREAFGAQALRWLDDDTAVCASYLREFALP